MNPMRSILVLASFALALPSFAGAKNHAAGSDEPSTNAAADGVVGGRRGGMEYNLDREEAAKAPHPNQQEQRVKTYKRSTSDPKYEVDTD